jgi:hypothetical protein
MRSQAEYGPHGLRICTPVSLLVCARFVRDGAPSLTPEVVDGYMRSAHDMYERRFPHLREPASLATLLAPHKSVPNTREVLYGPLCGSASDPAVAHTVDPRL